MIDTIARRIGYRVRPSFIWRYERARAEWTRHRIRQRRHRGRAGRAARRSHEAGGPLLAGGGLDPGYPLPGKIRQARFPLPAGTDWKGLRLKAELEVKGIRYPVRWACRQALEADYSLKLRPTQRPGLRTFNE